jgi:hypothetical protein
MDAVPAPTSLCGQRCDGEGGARRESGGGGQQCPGVALEHCERWILCMDQQLSLAVRYLRQRINKLVSFGKRSLFAARLEMGRSLPEASLYLNQQLFNRGKLLQF